MRHCRTLNPAECEALPQGLVQAVDGIGVRLIAAPHPWARLVRVLGYPPLIMVRGRDIFWPGLPDDLSTRPQDIALLAHELTHVWQYAHGLNLWRYLWREVRHLPHVYSYELIPGRPFSAYGYEQQAAMVEDWVRQTLSLPPRWGRAGPAALKALIPFTSEADT